MSKTDGLFNFLRGLYQLVYKPEKPMAYRLKRDGCVVGVCRIKPDRRPGLLIRFQRKLTPSDLQHGKIVSVVSDQIIRRGGKRKIEVPISLEQAESLYLVLGKAIANAKAIERQEATFREMVTIISASR